MGRILLSLGVCILMANIGFSQCPDLPNNVQVNGTNDTEFAFCGIQSAAFTVSDINLPNGTIDWYSSATMGFDPPSSGSLIGSSVVNSNLAECSPCPEIEAVYIDVCTTGTAEEEDNEFFIVSTGGGFNVDNFSAFFPSGGVGGDSDINVGGICNWSLGNVSIISGCSDIVAVGSGDYIPANSILIVQNSITASINYDMSSICGIGDCIYVIQNGCDRNTAAFANTNSAPGPRVTTISLGCGCSNSLTYFPENLPVGGNGTYSLQNEVYGITGCTHLLLFPLHQSQTTTAQQHPSIINLLMQIVIPRNT